MFTVRFGSYYLAGRLCARLRERRRRLKISQADLAELVGAANKSVVYQWESGKRVPSPVFWDRVLAITGLHRPHHAFR